VALLALLAVTTGPHPRAAVAAGDFPYDLDTPREASLLAAGAGLLAAGVLLGSDNEPLTPAQLAQLDPGGVRGLDRVVIGRWSPRASTASDRLVLALALAPLGQAAVGAGRERGGRLVLMYAETQLLAGGLTSLLKHTVQRPRPFAYGDDPRVPPARRLSGMARRSFPSGHAAQAFAAAVFLGSVQGRLQPRGEGWVWAGGLGAAGAVAWLRGEAGAHFPTDVAAGAAIGALAGWLVPKLHEADTDAGGGPGEGATLAVGFAF
jgi:membrane-associated phospholipid phosphatase